MQPKLLILLLCLVQVLAQPKLESFDYDDLNDDMHSYINEKGTDGIAYYNAEEEIADYWINQAQLSLKEKLLRPINNGIAKNVIMFLGDGMSLPTLTAARTYLGQSNSKPGEETQLSFEKFPYAGLAKTYCVDNQVADSACSATAYLCGVKANKGTIGVTAAVKLGDCNAMQNSSNHVYSIARWSQLKGKRTGVVTTTTVTHASPAGVYAHTANRNWQSSRDISESGLKPKECLDNAAQLVHGETGKKLNVILGGGRGMLIPISQKDDEGFRGFRLDKRNLINEWKSQKAGTSYEYVWNRTGLLDVSPNTEFLLGLFDRSNTKFNVDRDPIKKPSLAEMTKAAIKVLSQGENGYFLFVEGGLIDLAHHSSHARIALNETIEFHNAIQAAVDLTNPEDTLIVVTSDHSHTMSISGYSKRGNDILGIAGHGIDNLPYTTLNYANGRGYRKERNGHRHDISNDNLSRNRYRYPALVPLLIETHGGDDVGIFARGPWAHLFSGVNEQNVIPHIMAFASCVGEGTTICDDAEDNLGNTML